MPTPPAISRQRPRQLTHAVGSLCVRFAPATRENLLCLVHLLLKMKIVVEKAEEILA